MSALTNLLQSIEKITLTNRDKERWSHLFEQLKAYL